MKTKGGQKVQTKGGQKSGHNYRTQEQQKLYKWTKIGQNIDSSRSQYLNRVGTSMKNYRSQKSTKYRQKSGKGGQNPDKI